MAFTTSSLTDDSAQTKLTTTEIQDTSKTFSESFFLLSARGENKLHSKKESSLVK